jgi:hypothetical protein
MKKNSKQDLLERVKKNKQAFKDKELKIENFIDTVYGSMYYSEHTRIANLWSCKITDVQFTEDLEDYVKFPEQDAKVTAELLRFRRFVLWYRELGGEMLTLNQIEQVYPKFKIQ